MPRGGRLVVGVGAGGPVIDAIGDATSLPAEMRAALAQETDPNELTTRTAPACFAGLLAAAQGRLLVETGRPGGFRLAATLR